MKKYALNLHNDRWSKWLIIGLFFGGLILGIIAAQALNADTCAELGQGLLDNTPLASDNRTLSMTALKTNLWEILKIYLGGLCLFGSIFIGGYIFFKGFGFGFTLCFMLLENPWQDWSITLGTAVVPQLLFLPVMFMAAVIMFQMSLQIFYYTKGELLKELLRATVWLILLVLLTVLVSLITGGLAFRLLS